MFPNIKEQNVKAKDRMQQLKYKKCDRIMHYGFTIYGFYGLRISSAILYTKDKRIETMKSRKI